MIEDHVRLKKSQGTNKSTNIISVFDPRLRLKTRCSMDMDTTQRMIMLQYTGYIIGSSLL